MGEIITINPATEVEIQRYSEHSDATLSEKVKKAHATFLLWKETSFEERKKLLRQLSRNLRDTKQELSQIMQNEMGKNKAEADAEIEKCALCAEYYAQNGADHLANIPVQTEFPESYITFQPLGTILAIMPWNFPFWQALRAAIPAIMAGNSLLLKHASNVTGCSLAIEAVFLASGAPEGLFQALLCNGSRALNLLSSPFISGITFTGSTDVGKQIAAEAGRNLKKCVLELGGSDPYIILDDANIQKSAQICAYSRLINSGQSCISAKRIIVHKDIFSAFQSAFLVEIEKLPLAPLARKDLRIDLHNQVLAAVQKGAKLLVGGIIPDGKGFYYPATILTDVNPGNPAFENELFGPVAALIKADSNEQAISLANQSTFGLGAAIFSENISRAEKWAATKIEAGSCFVNSFVRSDPRLPFGGIKDSGHGRELSFMGIREFTNAKTIVVSN